MYSMVLITLLFPHNHWTSCSPSFHEQQFYYCYQHYYFQVELRKGPFGKFPDDGRLICSTNLMRLTSFENVRTNRMNFTVACCGPSVHICCCWIGNRKKSQLWMVLFRNTRFYLLASCVSIRFSQAVSTKWTQTRSIKYLLLVRHAVLKPERTRNLQLDGPRKKPLTTYHGQTTTQKKLYHCYPSHSREAWTKWNPHPYLNRVSDKWEGDREKPSAVSPVATRLLCIFPSHLGANIYANIA